MTHRFEVDYKTRLKQRHQAINAERLPFLGYRQYKIYEPEEKKYIQTINNQQGKIRSHTTSQGVHLYFVYDSFYSKIAEDSYSAPKFKIEWLKPKQATLLRLQGIKVEEH